MRNHGPWKILASQEVYRDPWLVVRKDEVLRPDGLPGTYSVARLLPGVCVVPIDEGQQVHLTEEFHYGVGRVTLEAVSGGIEAGEDGEVTARRELKEELGIRAANWLDLGTVDPFTGSVVSPTQMFLARDLEFGETRREGTELIRPVSMPLQQAVQDVLSSRISHGPTCVALLKTAWLLRSANPSAL